MNPARIIGVGLWGSGLPGFPPSRAVLAGQAPWAADDAPPPVPGLLPPAERRRLGTTVRLALAAAAEAVAMAGIDPRAAHNVFATSNGDGAVVHALLEELARPAPLLSPTQFHNSVHNAAAGYWTIAIGSRAPTQCIALHDATFAAGLLAAMAELADGAPVLLCAHDAPLPAPLAAKRRTETGFAAAFVLAPAQGEPAPGSLGRLSLHYEAEAAAAPFAALPPALRRLAEGNPAAQALPLLAAIASGRPARLALPYLDARLELAFEPERAVCLEAAIGAGRA